MEVKSITGGNLLFDDEFGLVDRSTHKKFEVRGVYKNDGVTKEKPNHWEGGLQRENPDQRAWWKQEDHNRAVAKKEEADRKADADNGVELFPALGTAPPPKRRLCKGKGKGKGPGSRNECKPCKACVLAR